MDDSINLFVTNVISISTLIDFLVHWVHGKIDFFKYRQLVRLSTRGNFISTDLSLQKHLIVALNKLTSTSELSCGSFNNDSMIIIYAC